MKLILSFLFITLSCAASLVCAAQKDAGGYTSLFDGKTLNGWTKVAGNANYQVENGMIVGKTVTSSPNTFLITDKDYGDFVLQLEVKIEDTTSNSGIQFRSHYDAAGHEGKGKVYGYQYELDPSSRRWTAGIYDEGRRDWLYPLSLHSSAQSAFKLGEWNTVKIECIGNETKTWINNIPAAYMVDTVDKSGIIALQVHAIGDNAKLAGEKIEWKNIRIKTSNIKPSAFPTDVYVLNNIPNTLSDYEKASGWKLLFDGKGSKGWRSVYSDSFPKVEWQVKDGMITVLSSAGKEGGTAGDVITKDEYSAFDLSFQFRLTPGANSGVKYFVTLDENAKGGSAIGLEYQVLDDSLHPDAKLGRNGDRTLASLYDLIAAQKEKRFIHQPGEWNTGRIIVYPNNHVEHYLNGIKVLEYERGSKAFEDLVAISKFKIWNHYGEAKQGHILLQDHGNEVSYRSIKIKTLK